MRFSSQAAAALRRAIRSADGVEVFAIGDVDDGTVIAVTIVARGQKDRVNALRDRPRAGQVVIHNHPSGRLEPSDADMQLAGQYGDDGIGFIIVDSDVSRDRWVIEPLDSATRPVDPEDIERYFREDLGRVLAGVELREGQLAMAHRVAAALSDDRPFVCEAGTGTGKSLAYLVPAALWAILNDRKVVVSTYTRALQGQLSASDIPLLGQTGLPVRAAVLLGRNNYLCKRRTALALSESAGQPDHTALADLAAWERTGSGCRSDLQMAVEPALWDRVMSDSDLSLRQRCSHYHDCHYYQARRRASAAHIIVVNHALLLTDLAIRDAGGPGVIPKYDRVVLDEAHHLESAATGAIARRLTARAIRRAVGPLLPAKRRSGALDRLTGAPDPSSLARRTDRATGCALRLRDEADAACEMLSEHLGPSGSPTRITEPLRESPRWQDITTTIEDLSQQLEETIGALDAVEALFGEAPAPERSQPILDLQRAKRRLSGHVGTLAAFLQGDEANCSWLEGQNRQRAGGAAVVVAPIDVSEPLQRLLWDRYPGCVATSATMTVAGNFSHWLSRAGLVGAETAVFPSPFDHAKQALLALPRDVVVPDHPEFMSASTRIITEAIQTTAGGAFVLCTSYSAIRHYSDALREALPATWPVLAQGEAPRDGLLRRFKESGRAVLVGTDSFWEGVDVKGSALRLVIIPRLPFRVPTDPLRVARHERIRARGGDAFLAYSLPEAVIMLRQGYGRLIRSRRDRGSVLILDRRIHERRYGAIMLRSLPPARRANGPWRRVREILVEAQGES